MFFHKRNFPVYIRFEKAIKAFVILGAVFACNIVCHSSVQDPTSTFKYYAFVLRDAHRCLHTPVLIFTLMIIMTMATDR